MITSPEIQRLFNRVAPKYDLLNRLLSARRDVIWRRAAARLLAPAVPGPLLDLACGTFDLSLELAGQYPDRPVIGCDFSLEMIKEGAPKLARSGGRISPSAGDGQCLPFADNSFAGATIAFGVRNIPDRDLALRELHRVLKPGGRLVVLEFGTPTGAFGRIYMPYLLKLLPKAAALFTPDPEAYVYLGRSILDFPKPDQFARMMEQAGFTARYTPLTRGIAWLFVGAAG